MTIESRYSSTPSPERTSNVEELPRLNLPGILGALPPEQKTKFEDLMASVIPWRGRGFVFGVNGLFTFVPVELNERITRYVQNSSSEPLDDSREDLVNELVAIYHERKFNQMGTEELSSFV